MLVNAQRTINWNNIGLFIRIYGIRFPKLAHWTKLNYTMLRSNKNGQRIPLKFSYRDIWLSKQVLAYFKNTVQSSHACICE